MCMKKAKQEQFSMNKFHLKKQFQVQDYWSENAAQLLGTIFEQSVV